MDKEMLIKKISKSMCYALFLTCFSIDAFANNALDTVNNILQDRTQIVVAKTPEPEQIKDDLMNQDVSGLKNSLKNDYAFILFYRTSCPHCRKFDPTLKQFSINTNIPVKAFTLDGGVLPSFPDSINITQDVVEQYFGKNANIAVPALFIMNIKSLHVYPVASGEMSYVDLVIRMNQLTPKMLQVERGEHA